ncbi:MAG: epoxyqueuosine reductase QueH [Actinobacteria bacterium]|nr:epoxyqueuosine reductase QueH [Actinomycetota bacterium]MBL7123685.1 epoxyqueuosine reductase QueH [Actinomycetota bacterium]
MLKYSTTKSTILLHICCGTCALYPYFLLKQDFDITFFYYNPNIHPGEEYIKRLRFIKMISKKYSIPLAVGKYEVKKWFGLTRDLKDEPEGGSRCSLCFRMRLDKTADTAKKQGFDLFGTTLTISPHKNYKIINSLGLELASKKGINFYQADFKKMDGFKKTIELSKELNLYRQNYCGCIYSKR